MLSVQTYQPSREDCVVPGLSWRSWQSYATPADSRATGRAGLIWDTETFLDPPSELSRQRSLLHLPEDVLKVPKLELYWCHFLPIIPRAGVANYCTDYEADYLEIYMFSQNFQNAMQAHVMLLRSPWLKWCFSYNAADLYERLSTCWSCLTWRDELMMSNVVDVWQWLWMPT